MTRLIRALPAVLFALLIAGCSAGPSADAGHNDADVAFAQMMIPHHEQAIEMSETVLGKDGLDPRIRELAVDIKAAQGPEIGQLKAMLGRWGEPEEGHAGHGGHMDGMMTPGQLAELGSADAAAAGPLFLEQMIAHHEGAVEMARAQLDDGRDPEALELAGKVIEDQESEIALMEELLGR
ncbi:DUF305 domain-containing protein [Zafaria sp. Z1313]|uniref:DUF305 domain-containing protein n=1 Tax=Zafaria sp. Z1313 TaxID=3423202 RepID=UPI003D3031A9